MSGNGRQEKRDSFSTGSLPARNGAAIGGGYHKKKAACSINPLRRGSSHCSASDAHPSRWELGGTEAGNLLAFLGYKVVFPGGQAPPPGRIRAVCCRADRCDQPSADPCRCSLVTPYPYARISTIHTVWGSADSNGAQLLSTAKLNDDDSFTGTFFFRRRQASTTLR